jgi:hypothetical protein
LGKPREEEPRSRCDVKRWFIKRGFDYLPQRNEEDEASRVLSRVNLIPVARGSLGIDFCGTVPIQRSEHPDKDSGQGP